MVHDKLLFTCSIEFTFRPHIFTIIGFLGLFTCIHFYTTVYERIFFNLKLQSLQVTGMSYKLDNHLINHMPIVKTTLKKAIYKNKNL
jgi:hypothetical protein